MKIVCIIPARYQSSRFPGKPLVDICGKPMIQRVYEQVTKVKEFSEVYVATDDERIRQVCEEKNIKVLMTRNDHPVHVCRRCPEVGYIPGEVRQVAQSPHFLEHGFL